MDSANVARVGLIVFVVAVLGACATSKPRPVQPTYSATMQQAQARYGAHEVDGAKELFQQAAALDPTQADPWYRLARINFDEQNYGRAIVDAQEVLQRRPADADAQSILTIAGLRVAIEALGRLHYESNVEGPAHMEAEALAAKMRDVLGQNVLVPPESIKKATRRRRPVRREAPRAEDVRQALPGGTVPAATPPTPNAPPPPASTNPFQSLPGSSG